MTQEHILEYYHYTSPEFKGEGYWGLEHPGGCMFSCPLNKALDEPPPEPGRYKVTVATLHFEEA